MEDGIKGGKAYISVVSTAGATATNRVVRYRIGFKTSTGVFETHKQGLLTVNLPSLLDGVQGDQVAELGALHELLVIKQIMGHSRLGNSMIIQTSHGAIRKMTLWHKQGASKPFSSGYLVPYGRFLFGRFAEAEFVISKDVSWIAPEINSPNFMGEISVKDRLADLVFIPSIGTIEISSHAIERVRQRNNAWNYHDSWRFIVNQLRGNSLRKITLELAKEYKLKASHANGDRWYNPVEGWIFAFGEDDGHFVLSTMMVAERV